MNDRKKINESYLEDVSYSVYIDKKHENNITPLNHPLPREKHVWQDDNSVSKCQHCDKVFSLFIRKHHCRLCGKIYCFECSKYKDPIPDTILSDKSIKTNWLDYVGSYIYITDITTHRVCMTCHNLIMKIFKIKKIIEVFLILKLDILELKKVGQMSKLWLNASNYCLSKFREIQYKLVTDDYTKIEIDMLWNNIKYINGHSKYLKHLVKICKSDIELEKVAKIMDNPKPIIDCKTLMCSRNCNKTLNSLDAINLLDYSIKKKSYSKIAKEIAIKYLVCNDIELKCFIPLLVYYIKNDTYGVIRYFLINKCMTNYDLVNTLYRELDLYTYHDDNSYRDFFNIFKKILSDKKYEAYFDKILIGNKFINVVSDIAHAIHTDNKSYEDIKDSFQYDSPTYLPLNSNIKITRILLNKIKIKNSATKPILIPCVMPNNEIYKLIHKNEDVRKDQIIMIIINLIEQIVKREEGIDLDIIKYNILPTGPKSGLIEIVNNSDTIYHIQENLKSTILNYIMEDNDKMSVKELRTRFIKSTAAYCVITYLLGIGDRHLDNIMINKDGRLFHIDFGYILGMDPVFNNPGIRITENIVDALGGFSSKYYIEFQELATIIYNCLRRNIDVFMHLLFLIPNITEFKLTEEQIKEQIIMRFRPGESNINAKMHLVTQLDKLYYADKIKDWCHYYNKEQTISGALSRLSLALSSLWYPSDI
jgi:hypothetical protein